MLNLVYDIKCGYDKLYIVEKNCRYSLDVFCKDKSEHAVYKMLSGLEQDELEEVLVYEGVLNDIINKSKLDCYNKYFKASHKQYPDVVKITNIKVAIGSDVEEEQKPDTLRAGDVMDILNISRQTLSRYVKEGLIKATKLYENGQYTYDTESVYKLIYNKEHEDMQKLEKLIKRHTHNTVADKLINFIEMNFKKNTAELLQLYTNSTAVSNDINIWDMSDHINFINSFYYTRKMLYPIRYISEELKEAAIRREEVGTNTTIDRSTVDVELIMLWEHGGFVGLDNIQVLPKDKCLLKSKPIYD